MGEGKKQTPSALLLSYRGYSASFVMLSSDGVRGLTLSKPTANPPTVVGYQKKISRLRLFLSGSTAARHSELLLQVENLFVRPNYLVFSYVTM